MESMYRLVLLRHGESEWNRQNRFTGWTDVGLSVKGKREAKQAGKLLKKEGFVFDVAFTSVLKRAIDTTKITLKEMGLKIPVEESWRLNERHYGALQGLNKAETSKKYGEEQVFLWRRGYAIRPPLLKGRGESLKDTYDRVLPYWKNEIVPAIKSGKKVLVSAHGNSLRALIKYLDGISDKKILELNLPTGVPLVYELDEKLKPKRHYYLGSAALVRKKISGVKKQANSKRQ